MFRVLSCVIYTIISNYFFIDYLGYDETNLIDLRLGVSGSYKHLDKKYHNILGFGISDLLLDFLSCQAFLKTMNLLS